jgi:glycosyltransferase involved in cell wall biosynthesis
MKVLLTNFHPHGGGGHTTYLKYLFQEFTKSDDIDVYIACPQTSKLFRLCSEINQEHTFAVDFPAKVKEFPSVIKNTKILANLIKEHRFDILHVNGNPEHKMAMYCQVFYGLQFKIVRTKHESKAIKDNFFTNLQYKKFMNAMIVVSNYQLKTISKQFILDKTHIIHNGVDTKYFSHQTKSTSLMDKYHLCDHDLVFVSVAGTALHKGWQYLVDAISMLEDKSHIKIILAGNLPKEEIYHQYVVDKHMQNNVIFTGMLDDVREIIGIGDIGFVLSTSVETISFACREMMSMGKPVIVSNYAGLPENIDPDKNGWVVQTKDTASLLSKVQEIVANRSNIQHYAVDAMNKAHQEFTLSSFIQQTQSIYKKVLTK